MNHAVYVIGSGVVCGMSLGTLAFWALYSADSPLYVCMLTDWAIGGLTSGVVVWLMVR